MQVLSVASEIFPLVKTGGLADVAGALPAALAQEGVAVRTLVPGYPAVLERIDGAETIHAFAALFGGPARLLAATGAGLPLFVLDAPHLYGRAGNPYLDPNGRDWSDNGIRFAALGLAGARLAQGLAPGYAPDVLHAHDWQAGLAPAYLHYSGAGRPGTVATIHNIAFQGLFRADLFPLLGLPEAAFAMEGVEFFGRVGFLKAALHTADRITTVSPTYAEEILTPEFGMGLEGVLQARGAAVSGILNGIDETVWNPDTDPHLPFRYDARRTISRRGNKRALQRRLGLAEQQDTLLVGVVSRLSWQKGLDLVLEAWPEIRGDVQFAVVGAGDRGLERAFEARAAAEPKRIGVFIGYDEALAHLVQGGADALLVPSRFEPCGLTQLCAMRYGALPIVSRVGGLADTVVDANAMALAAGVATGFQFAPAERAPLERALRRALSVWEDGEAWRRMQRNAMAAPVGWERPAERYAAIYREAAGLHRPSAPAEGPEEGVELE